jgi:hypothetical protein
VLQELSVALENEGLSIEDRTAMLKKGVEKLLMQYPQLWEDPMYQAFISHLGCSAQPVSAL